VLAEQCNGQLENYHKINTNQITQKTHTHNTTSTIKNLDL